MINQSRIPGDFSCGVGPQNLSFVQDYESSVSPIFKAVVVAVSDERELRPIPVIRCDEHIGAITITQQR